MSTQNGKRDNEDQDMPEAESAQEREQSEGVDRSIMDEQGRGGIPSGHEAETGDGEEESDPATSAGN